MENVKNIIILFIIFIIIIILILMILLNNQNNTGELDVDENYLEEGEELILEENDNGYIDVLDANIFYSIVSSVNKYIDIMQYDINNVIEDNDIFIQYNIDREYLFSIKSQNQKLDAIYKLLDERYKMDNKITLNSMDKFWYDIGDNTVLIPLQMKVKYGSTNINTYILKAYLNSGKLEEKYFIIRIDSENQTFSIEFIADNEKDIEKIKINENYDSIEKNEYNQFNIEIIKTDKIAQNYLEHYKKLSIQYPEIVYNNYLDKDYREKRFKTVENYKKYIEDNRDELEYLQITKYIVESENNETKYICLDQYQNTYVFTTTAVMQYTIILDTYTIETNKFKNTYSSSDNQTKVMMNVDKFVKMINNRDYSAVYNVLDDNFKNSIFASKEEFEQYFRQNYPLHYEVEYFSFEEIGNKIFVQKIKFKDITGLNTDTIDFTVIMKLDDDTEFSMSFEIL